MQKRNSKITEILIYLLIGAISLIALLASIVMGETAPFISSFLHELSFAGFISLIVIFTVEKFSRARHEAEAVGIIEKINHNLFLAIYRRYVPLSVFHEAERLLLYSEVYRTSYSVNYVFESLEEASIFVVSVQTSYELVNPSEEAVTHTIIMRLERPMRQSQNHLCQMQHARLGGVTLDAETIQRHVRLDDTSLVFAYPLKVQAMSKIIVEMGGTLTKEIIDTEIWTTSLPADGLRLSVSMPSNIRVAAKSIHSQSLDFVQHQGKTKIWEIGGGLLPNQGLTFWWHPADTEQQR